MASKNLMLNMTLDEIKKLTPEEAIIVVDEMGEMAKQIERANNGY